MRKCILIAVCALALYSAVRGDESSVTKATVNIDGKIYMGNMPVGEDGTPNADGTLTAPVYAAFSQIEDRFCCTMATISADDSRPGLTQVVLAPFYGTKGKITNKNLECTLELDTGALKLSVPVKGTVQANGNITVQLIQPFAKPVPITFVPVNTGARKYSGIYIGTVWEKGKAQPKVNNMGVAFTARGNSVTGTTLFYLSDEPGGILLDSVKGTLNTATGAFSYVGEPPLNVEANGTIINGVFEIAADVGNQEYLAKAYHMSDTNWANPNISKKPKPKKLPSGKKTTVTIAQTNCIPCGVPHLVDLKLKSTSVPSANDPAIYLESYTINPKNVELVFVTAKGAKGTFKLEFINPSGKKGMSKKFKIK